MNGQIAQKNGDNKQFIVNLYEQSLIFEREKQDYQHKLESV